jgi:signal transduction histidine kinase/CheY-like chemotaxis protein/predicted RNA-binding protein with RPS1 domain
MFASKSLLRSYPRFSVVSGTVKLVGERGVDLIIAGHIEGHIPTRELSWPADGPSEPLRQGQQVQAIVIKEDVELGRLILSYRLTLRNPWRMIAKEYPVGAVRVGKITRVFDTGVYIELETGIEGFISVEDIPMQSINKEPIDLWPDDEVLVQVKAVYPDKHRITLSLWEPLKEQNRWFASMRNRDESHGVSLREMVETKNDPLAAAASTLPWLSSASIISRILIVDDEKVFGEATRDWLRLLGYKVDYASNTAEARDFIMQSKYDLLLLDYQLAETTGVEVAQLAKAQQPTMRRVLLSAQVDEAMCRIDLAPTYGMTCWRKPFPVEGFAELLALLDDEPKPNSNEHEEPDESVAVEWHGQIQPPTLESVHDICSKQLGWLMSMTGAELGVVFEIPEGSQHVTIISEAGASATLHNISLQQLLYSPVKDICIEGLGIRVPDIKQDSRRFRNLLRTEFRSFLGAPVRGGYKNPWLGITLFHKNIDHFTGLHEEQIATVARLIASILERQDVLLTSVEAQQTILVGRVALGLVHEVRGGLSGVVGEISKLRMQLQSLYARQGQFNYKTIHDLGLTRQPSQLERALERMSRILDRHLDFARPYGLDECDLNGLVEHSIELVRPDAPDTVDIIPELDKRCSDIYSAPLLIQQILINLLFNAVQHVGVTQFERHGILVYTQYVDKDPPTMRVLVRDSGIGIHTYYRKNLFQHGFTTRKGGTGLGLFISRAAAEALGGDLFLEESYMGFGSTFVLELPVHASERTHAQS